jgi:hypothetical protein
MNFANTALSGRVENEADKRRVMQLADEVWSLLPKNPLETKTLEDYLQVPPLNTATKQSDAIRQLFIAA